MRFSRHVAALLLLTGLVVTQAEAHPFDTPFPEPRTYTEAIRQIRDELAAIRTSPKRGDSLDPVPCATRIGRVARSVPPFALSLTSALEDSALGRILQASQRLAGAADAMALAAAAQDRSTLAREVARCDEWFAVLDAYVPRRYVCPMHCERNTTYERPGSCPLCGMHLQLVTSDSYAVQVRSSEGGLRAGVPAMLDFQIRDPAGFEVESLQVVHEKRLHLMIVSHDLARFAHVHPIPEAHGSFRLRHTFPTGGTYVLYHDFTPDSVGMQVVPVEVNVAGPEPEPVTLVVDEAPKRERGCEVTLTHSALVPDAECSLVFTLTRRGRPVNDLEPFLGATGHLVMVSQDRVTYLHSHPRELLTGPRVEFRTWFPRTGLYKAWAQFQRGGRVLTVPFVVEVTSRASAGTLER
jgi:hypothetical protein